MGGLSGDSKGGFSDIARSIADAFAGTTAAVGPGNPDQRNTNARDNSSGGPAAAGPGSDKGTGGGTGGPGTKRGPAPTPAATPAPAPEVLPAAAPRPGPAPIKKKSLLTGGGLARPTLGGVAKTILGS
jgi:hypothetical protein